jgi:hypothetical protein
VFQLVLKTLKHLSFSRDQMQFEIDMTFQIEKISSGENIIISRGSSGFSKNFIIEISEDTRPQRRFQYLWNAAIKSKIRSMAKSSWIL